MVLWCQSSQPQLNFHLLVTNQDNLQMRWPKFQNIHRLIADDELNDALNFTACEKLDGSNLGLEIDPIRGLRGIHGRKSALWKSTMSQDPFLQTYGSVKGTLKPIQDLIPKLKVLSAKVLEEEEGPLVTKTVVFFGEWFQKADQKEGSWHPFGYALCYLKLNDEGEKEEIKSVRTMTTERHQMFQDHGLDPPKLLFPGGTIYELIEALFPIMMDPAPRFEGAFITSQVGGTRNCAKWKTGAFEEQASFVISHDEQRSEHMMRAVDKLFQVYEKKGQSITSTKAAKPSQRRVTQRTAQEQAIDRQIHLALHSVLSKSPHSLEDIRAMDRPDQIPHLRRLNAKVLADVSETYVASDLEIPKEVKKRVGKIVSDLVK